MSEWTQADIDAVHETARARYYGAMNEGRGPVAGQPTEETAALANHILGCFGELAIAKELRVPWSRSVGQYDHRIPDVGIFHVRAGGRHHHKLIIRPEDVDETFPYVLVTTEKPPLDIVIQGWIYRKEATMDSYWQAPNGRPGAWFVPRHALSMPL